MYICVCRFWGEGRQKNIVLIVGGFGPFECQCCMCKLFVHCKCYTEKFFFPFGSFYLTGFLIQISILYFVLK